MKKLICTLIIFCQIFSLINVSAKSGDISGNIYSTDIRAFINGVEVPSYNIGGKTAVVIEDITKNYACNYSDYYRTFKIFTLSPLYLVSGASAVSGTPGKIAGHTYETDIKTTIYDVEIPSYNIGGKTAVAIEDLGKNGEFSELGGKYTWDADNRTISLEFMYSSNYGSILIENHADMTISINEDLTEGYASFTGNPYDGGSVNAWFEWPEWFSERDAETEINAIIPLMADIDGQKELVGYHFYHSVNKTDLNPQDFTAFTYVYEEKFKAASANFEMPEITIEDVINHYQINRVCTLIERFDTEEYTFAYMSAATPHGSSHVLLLIKPDGSYYNYSRDFEPVSIWGTRRFENVKIDKEAEKVYLHYDADYVIDLKTGVLSKAN